MVKADRMAEAVTMVAAEVAVMVVGLVVTGAAMGAAEALERQ